MHSVCEHLFLIFANYRPTQGVYFTIWYCCKFLNLSAKPSNTQNFSTTLSFAIICNARDGRVTLWKGFRRLQKSSTILSPNPVHHVCIFIVPRCITKESDTRRATSVIWPPKDVHARYQYVPGLSEKGSGLGRALTRKHDTPIRNKCLGENVYLCPCFCDAPVTRPGNCTWLLWWAVTFIFDSFGSHPATVAVLKDTRHFKDLLRLILLAGSEAISSDATRAPRERWCWPIISVRVILCTSHVLQPMLKEMYLHVSMKIHFAAWSHVTSCSLALAQTFKTTFHQKWRHLYDLSWCIFCNVTKHYKWLFTSTNQNKNKNE